MEEDRPQLEKIAFPFSDLVSETAQSFQGLAKAQNKTVQLSIQPMITLVGEEKSLRQLVSILLDNALKYSKEGGWIRLSLPSGWRISSSGSTGATVPAIPKQGGTAWAFPLPRRLWRPMEGGLAPPGMGRTICGFRCSCPPAPRSGKSGSRRNKENDNKKARPS